MKDLIFNYIEKHYRFTLTSHKTYKLYDAVEKKYVGLKEVLLCLKVIFDIKDDELLAVFDEWADTKDIEMADNVNKVRKTFFEENGFEAPEKELEKLINGTYHEIAE